MTVIEATAPPLYVAWGCRRCGLNGQVARTTIPVTNWSREMYRQLLADLRLKLVRSHLERHGCNAAFDDFWIDRHVPSGKTLVGRI